MLVKSIIITLLLFAWMPQSMAANGDVTTNRLVNRFVALDRNGDGVSFAEFMVMVEARARQEYKHMDGNGDGRVSRYEYKSFWNAKKAKYYRVKR